MLWPEGAGENDEALYHPDYMLLYFPSAGDVYRLCYNMTGSKPTSVVPPQESAATRRLGAPPIAPGQSAASSQDPPRARSLQLLEEGRVREAQDEVEDAAMQRAWELERDALAARASYESAAATQRDPGPPPASGDRPADGGSPNPPVVRDDEEGGEGGPGGGEADAAPPEEPLTPRPPGRGRKEPPCCPSS